MGDESQGDFFADIRPNTSNSKRQQHESSVTATYRRKTGGGKKTSRFNLDDLESQKHHLQIDLEGDNDDDDDDEPLPPTSSRGEPKKRQKRETVLARKKPSGKRSLFEEDDITEMETTPHPVSNDDEVNSFIKKKKAAAAAAAAERRSTSQDSDAHLVALGIDGGFDDIVVESNLPTPSQNVEFMVAKIKKQLFEKFRENDVGKSTAYAMIDLPLTSENGGLDTQKFACVKLSCKLGKKMSKLLSKMEVDWTTGIYPVQAIVILRKGFDMSSRTNGSVLELLWPAVQTLHDQGKCMIRHFESKIAGKAFRSIDDIPLPKPVILQVNPRITRGAKNVHDVGTQIMLTMTINKWGETKMPQVYFNIREHYKDKETNEWKPIAKGITVGHKAFHTLIHPFHDVVAFLIDTYDRFRARIDQSEEDLDAELTLLTKEQKKKQVYNENILFEEDDKSQPIIETFSSDDE
jgi:Transcriptional Coactivator p15 (PC4)